MTGSERPSALAHGGETQFAAQRQRPGVSIRLPPAAKDSIPAAILHDREHGLDRNGV